MTFDKLISLCNPVDVSGPEPNALGALTQDSRDVQEGSVFIAVRGFQTDGHRYIVDAIGSGASVIICEEAPETEENVCIIKVEQTRPLVGPLAQAFEGYPANKLTVIGITGTNGKTTVATLTYQALESLGASPSLLGTVAKRIAGQELTSSLTTSDPVELAADMSQMVEAGSTHLVMEVSSHALDQDRVAGIDYRVGAFTNLSHDHLDYHEDLESYASAKKKLFDSLGADDYAVINGDDEKAAFMVMDCEAEVIDFSFKKALRMECQVLQNSIAGLVVRIGKTMIESPLVGAFNAYNLTEAFLICRALGYESDEIANALSSAPGAPGRLERVAGSGTNGNPVVLVDYAHTPDALENVAQTLADLKEENQQLHIVFGCGGNRDRTKRPKMARIAETYGDKITVTSDNPRNEDPDTIIDEIMEGFGDANRVERLTDREKAIRKAIYDGDEHTMILIAGKGHETYQEISGQRHDFDDREIARQALGHKNRNSNDEVT